MSFIVEMIHGTSNDPNHQVFRLPLQKWEELLLVAQAHGWSGAGTKPDPTALATCSDYMEHFKPDYRPNEWVYSKTFEKNDACQLAQALRKFHDSLSSERSSKIDAGNFLISDYSFEQDIIRFNQDLSTSLLRFIEFTECGEFQFAVDD